MGRGGGGCHYSPCLYYFLSKVGVIGLHERPGWEDSGNLQSRAPCRVIPSGLPPGGPRAGDGPPSSANSLASDLTPPRPRATPLQPPTITFPTPFFLLFSKAAPESKSSYLKTS